jgi:hypothetical protein
VLEPDTHPKRSSRTGIKIHLFINMYFLQNFYIKNMYMHIPCWAFTNAGQHLMDTKIDEVGEFEIIELDIQNVELDMQKVELDIPTVAVDIQKVDVDIPTVAVDIQKVDVDIQKVDIDIPTVAVDVDETLQDAFVSMFENIAWYIYTKNNITSILAELYT